MALFSERRQTIRIAVNGNMNVESLAGGPPLRLVDVGIGGFCVQTATALPATVVTSYRFITLDKKWSAIFRARAVHSKLIPPCEPSAGQFLTGFSFLNTDSPAVQRELMALMDHATAFMSFS